MTKQLAVYGGMLAILTIGTGQAFAFEETTVRAQPAQPAAQQEQVVEGLAFDLQMPDAGDAGGDGLKLQSSGSLKVAPKMDFGLELLYSSKDEDDPIAHAGADINEGDDVRVLGTIKRRF